MNTESNFVELRDSSKIWAIGSIHSNIDSFNGIYNLFDDLESARFVNSCLMLLSALGKQSDCSIVVTGMAKKNDSFEWILSPGGKHIMKLSETNVYYLKKIENNLTIRIIDNDQNKSKEQNQAI